MINRHRREVLTGLGGVVATTAAFGAARVDGWRGLQATPEKAGSAQWPRRSDFNIEDGYTYLNAAYTQPLHAAQQGESVGRVPAATGEGARCPRQTPRVPLAERDYQRLTSSTETNRPIVLACGAPTGKTGMPALTQAPRERSADMQSTAPGTQRSEEIQEEGG